MDRISDEAYVSQYVSREEDSVRPLCRPRPQDLDGLSVFVGLMSAAEACFNVRRGKNKRSNPDSSDGVRRARVGDLKACGFEVIHTPSQRSERHASVRYAGEWDERRGKMFTECFGAVVWFGERDELLEDMQVRAEEAEAEGEDDPA